MTSTVHAEMQAAAARWGEEAPQIISSAARRLQGETIPDVVKQRLNSSHCWPDVLYALGSQPSELEGFIEVARSDWKAAARRITAIENLVDAAQFPHSKSIN